MVKNRKLMLPDEQWHYPAMEMLQAFDPSCEIEFSDVNETFLDGLKAILQEEKMILEWFDSGKMLFSYEQTISDHQPTKEEFKKAFYLLLSQIYQKALPWGTLTGIKPVKIAHELMYEGCLSRESVSRQMQKTYLVSQEKADLAAELAEKEMNIVHGEEKDGGMHRVSIYLGVPVCPTKCSYCSFVSTVADRKGKIVADYLDCLLNEIQAFNTMIREKRLFIDTLYIGGGTPSIFSVDQLSKLMAAMFGTIIHPELREFTFEAGRPETTTREKLEIMKAYGVDRICLNPQSMNTKTLVAVHRQHTPQNIIDVYEKIRKIGFKTVNMDLIVGLAEESPKAFFHSLDEVMKLDPENVTVHSLAVKHGSSIRESYGHQVIQLYDAEFYQEIQNRLFRNDYHPYYLYRQKYTQGSGENIGYSKPNYEGIYNILMMAERQTILGIGAGSSGKIYDAEKNRFEKIFTVKDIRTYNQKIEEIVEKKINAYINCFK